MQAWTNIFETINRGGPSARPDGLATGARRCRPFWARMADASSPQSPAPNWPTPELVGLVIRISVTNLSAQIQNSFLEDASIDLLEEELRPFFGGYLDVIIGYDNSAKIAKKAFNENLTLKEAALKLKLISEKDFDKIVDPAANAIENSLRQGYLSHLETFISRKLITRHVETLTQNKPNGSFNGKSALCVNFEDNLPDLGVVMSEVVLRHSGYNVYNTGSHADLGNLKTILEKKSVEGLLKKLSNAFELIETTESTVVTNLRHYEFLSQALISLAEVEKGLENNISGDLLSIDLRKAIDSIGEITGQITNDEMLGNIFSNFCIGK